MRVVVAWCLIVALAASARAERVHAGAAAGLRWTTLGGELAEQADAKPAVAGVVRVPVSASWSVLGEPGVTWSGAHRYGLVYATLAILADYGRPIARRWRVHAMGGLVPAYLASAHRINDAEYGSEDISDGLRAWDLRVTVGVGLVWQRRYSIDLRFSRGVRTIDGSREPLFLVNEDLWLYTGVVL